MNKETNIIYTDSAKKCLEKVKENYLKQIEELILERKNIPGEVLIEITASDVNDALQSLIVLKRSKREEWRNLIIYTYLILGLFISLFGLFYGKIGRILSENPIQVFYLIIGFMMVFASILLLKFTRKKESLKHKSEYDILNKYIQRLEEKLEAETKETDIKIGFIENLYSAETSRLHAKIADEKKMWETAALWWSRALSDYAAVKDEGLINASVFGLKRALLECDKMGPNIREKIEKVIDLIPQSLSEDKVTIKAKLNNLS